MQHPRPTQPPHLSHNHPTHQDPCATNGEDAHSHPSGRTSTLLTGTRAQQPCACSPRPRHYLTKGMPAPSIESHLRARARPPATSTRPPDNEDVHTLDQFALERRAVGKLWRHDRWTQVCKCVERRTDSQEAALRALLRRQRIPLVAAGRWVWVSGGCGCRFGAAQPAACLVCSRGGKGWALVWGAG
eukprot:357632-Chlamydomonas_euryale.AAC.2